MSGIKKISGIVEVTCDNCGDIIYRFRSLVKSGIKRGLKHSFCGRSCYFDFKRKKNFMK